MHKNTYIWTIGFLLFILLSTTTWADPFPNAALNAAEDFVREIDFENYETAYGDVAPLLQTLKSKEAWIQEIKPVKEIMGDVLSRSLKAIKKMSSYPGLPDGEYVQVYFETEMANKKKAAEIILISQTNGSWKVCLYSLK